MPASVNVASHLGRMAAAEPGHVAVYFPPHGVNPHGHTAYSHLTFAQLHADSDAVAHGLNTAGIVRGTRTALMVPPSLDFFTLTFALFKTGAVPVLIDPGMGTRNLGRCLGEAEPEAFIGIPKAHVGRRLFGWARRTIKVTVNVGRRRFFCHHSLAELRSNSRREYGSPDVAADEPAAILFTSGSTGVAKGVVYTHGIFAAQVELLKQTYGIEPGEIDLCTFPLFALYGPALGMTCVIPDMDATRPANLDPAKAVAQIRQFGVTNLFGSPAVIRRLGKSPLGRDAESAERSAALPTLRRVISAGAPASAPVIERFVKLLPETTEVFTPYGATEALPVANIGSREILGETRHLTEQGKGVCVGRPVAGTTVSVVPITDDAVPEWDAGKCLPPGEVGEFVVRGPIVTTQYHNRPEATKLAKMRDPRTGDTLHRMGDVGYLDDRGRLWFCGRKAHRVVTPHGTLFTDMVEPIFNTVEGVCRTALVGVTRGGVAHPVLCVELEAGDWPRVERDLREVGGRFAPTRAVTTFLLHPAAFPVDVRHNAKIFREKLAVWADRRLGPEWTPT